MSRIGKRILKLKPENKAIFENNTFSIQGPLGKLQRKISNNYKVEINEDSITVKNLYPKRKNSNIMYGTINSHISNMISGVNQKFVKVLKLVGVGYRARLDGQNIVLKLGFSHEVIVKIPDGIEVNINKQVEITISSIDKESLGLFAAKIRAFRKPEPYLGKGVRYKDEHIIRKEGKSNSKGK